ncbi:MAG: hypothetical protein KUG77_02370 [Nannocystaceae bacterium]|nr:hypothetical protein [Nannocystaceae bacterium]
MPPRARLLFALLATMLSCSLPLEEKAACDDGRDCLDGRACVAGQCTDGACGLACDAECSARNDCASTPACTEACATGLTSLAGLNPAQCTIQFDLFDGGSCEAVNCFDGCAVSCDRGVDCALIDDAATCTVQCQLEAICTELASACNELDAAALSCWSRSRARGC